MKKLRVLTEYLQCPTLGLIPLKYSKDSFHFLSFAEKWTVADAAVVIGKVTDLSEFLAEKYDNAEHVLQIQQVLKDTFKPFYKMVENKLKQSTSKML